MDKSSVRDRLISLGVGDKGKVVEEEKVQGFVIKGIMRE